MYPSNIDERWYEDDLVLKRFNSKSPYRQGDITIEEVMKELEKYSLSSVPNLVTLTQFDILKRPVA